MTRKAVITVLTVALIAVVSERSVRAEGLQDQAHGVLKTIVNYVPNVAMDFVDIFKANVALGETAGVDLRATRLLEAGISHYDVIRYGVNGRNSAIRGEAIHDAGIGLAGFVFGELDRSPYEIGITAHAMVGAELAVNVRSGLDFLGAIVFIDIEGDDAEYF